MYAACIIAVSFYFSPLNNSDTTMYWCCFFLGYASGFWAIIVTMGAEHFGTNIRATAATTIPNMVRGSLPLMNLMFIQLFQQNFHWSMVKSGIVTGIIVIGIALISLYKTEETFHKDLDYVEEQGIVKRDKGIEVQCLIPYPFSLIPYPCTLSFIPTLHSQISLLLHFFQMLLVQQRLIQEEGFFPIHLFL